MCFCQQQSADKTRFVASFPVSNKLLHDAKFDPVLRQRLECVNDLVAGDVRYHLKCYVKFTRSAACKDDLNNPVDERYVCMERVAHELSIGIRNGDI